MLWFFDRDFALAHGLVLWLSSGLVALLFDPVVAFPAAIVFLGLPVFAWRRGARRREALVRLREETRRHRGALVKNLRSAIKRNDYGAMIADETDAAIAEFLGSIEVSLPLDTARMAIERELAALRTHEASAGFRPDLLPQSGHAFEHWVAEALCQAGWDAVVTRGSGDQGIDVLARREHVAVGIQCKRQSRPVGNKAVQEAAAGRLHYGLDIAAVISDASFTDAAKRLAVSADILLLAPHDIPSLETKTGALIERPDHSHERRR